MKRFLSSLLTGVAVLAFACYCPPVNASEGDAAASQVKYVFLFIGDGMSIPQRTIADEYSRLTTGEGLAMNSLPVQGYSTTRCANSFITDSAASGTAIACGQKTNSGALGVNAANERIESVAETARRQGKKVGIVTTVQLNHATPAAFYAHNPSRGNYYDLSLDALESGFDFFGGGAFLDVDGRNAKESKGNFLELAKKSGYTVATTHEKFDALNTTPSIAIAPNVAHEVVPYEIDLEPGDVTLADLTRKAVELLGDSETGFFIMVEGGKIDWVGHANDVGASVNEVISLDNAVKVALDFAEAHPGETLIVVTGDHETGGMTVGFAGTGYSSYLEVLKNQKISIVAFQDLYTPIKNDADKTFDDVKPLITEYFGFKFEGDPAADRMVLSEKEQAMLAEAFLRSRGQGSYSAGEDKNILYSGYDPLMVSVSHLMANKAGISWTSFAHTALPVGTSAKGPHAENFSGMTDNTDIANRIRPLL